MKYLCAIAAVSALFSTVSAHGGVVEYSFNGEIYAGYDPGRSTIKKRSYFDFLKKRASSNTMIQREWDAYKPVPGGPGETDTICNSPGSPAQAYATIAAGGTVSACYNNPWPHNSGPLTVYMAACPNDDCTTLTDLDSLKWFAIYKYGRVNGKWATTEYMESNSNCITHIIPETLLAGKYLIRHETINLAKIEFYANCANVEVTGSGTATPADSFLATISEIYKPGDAALSTSAGDSKTYTVPGPNVWPADTAEGGQVFKVTGIRNPCSGEAQGSGGECADGGSDTSNPTPPNPQLSGSSSSSSSSSGTSSSSAAKSSTPASKGSSSSSSSPAKSSTPASKGSSSSSSSSAKSSTPASKGSSSSSSSSAKSSTPASKGSSSSSSSSSKSSNKSTPSDSAAKSKSSGSATVSSVTTEDVSSDVSSDTSSSSSSGGAGAWAQCGGGSTSATSCISGYTCKEYNQYYSQCVPE